MGDQKCRDDEKLKNQSSVNEVKNSKSIRTVNYNDNTAELNSINIDVNKKKFNSNDNSPTSLYSNSTLTTVSVVLPVNLPTTKQSNYNKKGKTDMLNIKKNPFSVLTNKKWQRKIQSINETKSILVNKEATVENED